MIVRRTFALALALALTVGAHAACTPSQRAAPAATFTRVLFVGNSYS